jgi:tetratricopeptide (TPR) repeat protein
MEADAKAWCQLAKRNQDEGRDEEALAAWEQAMAHSPTPARPATARANLLLDLGRIEEAAAAFAEALAFAPGHGPALYGRASIERFRGQASDIGSLERSLAGARTDDDRFHLHFALGRAYLDQDEAPPAFRHFAAGNALRRAGYRYDVAEDELLLSAIAACFPAERLARQGELGDPDETPVFIVGMPRSGTSLLEQILSAHPDIHGAGELLTVKRLVLKELVEYGMFPGVAADLTAEQCRLLGARYLAATRPLAPAARRIIDKLPLNFYFAGLIRLMLPGARIIHIRRDPLDTCLSCHTTLFRETVRYTPDQTELGRFHRAYQRLMAHWRQVLPTDRFIEVEYADLVADPEAEARRLLAFCGLGWDVACLSPERLARPIRTASRLQARQPVHRDSVGRAERYRPYLGPLIAALDA